MTIAKFEVPDWIRSVLICDPTDIWGNVVGMGLAELAARLVGLGGYDRRGNAIFFDTFNEGLGKCATATSGTLSAVELSTTSVRGEGFSAKLTAGSDLARYAQVYYYAPYPILSKVGLETSFTLHTDTEYIRFSLFLADGTTGYDGQIRYDKVNSKVQYLDSLGAWQDLITSISLFANAKAYHTLKLVIDLSTKKYHRVLLDGWSWLTGGISIYSYTFGGAGYFIATVEHSGASGKNPVSYVDNVLITQNEPA